MPHDDPSGPNDWSLSRIVVALQNELLGPLYSISSNTKVLAGKTTPAEHRRLISANLQSVTTLERSLTRVVELANLSNDSLVLRASNTSIHSMTHEAALSASSDMRDPPEVATEILGPDAIVHTDHARTASMISNALQSMPPQGRARSLTCSTKLDQSSALVSVLWTAKTIQPLVEVSASSPVTDHSARRTGSSSYFHAVAFALGAEVDEAEDRSMIRLTAEFPVIHSVDWSIDDESQSNFDQARVLQYAPTVDDCFELPLDTAFLDQDDDLSDRIATASASLLVLNHTSQTDEHHLATNLYFSQKSTIPVLLRSAHLSYDQFVRYRDHVDAILLEPAAPDVLTRYIGGLSRINRRSHRRRASLH